LLLVLALAAACVPSSGTPEPTPVAASSTLPNFKQVIVIVLENREATAVTPESMPYLWRLGERFAVADRSFAVTHPSLPNYLALLSGDTFNIRTTCHDCIQAGETLVDQIERSGRTWTAYMQGMPSRCFLEPEDGLYAMKHNPFLYFRSIRDDPARCQRVVPLDELRSDLARGALADFVWITPDLCDSGHDCDLSKADRWLESVAEPLMRTPAFRDGGVLFVTWDEGISNDGCCGNAAGGRIFTVAASPHVAPGTRSPTPMTHYSLLRTIQDAWGLPPLRQSASAAAVANLFVKPG
jgi:hypothetical protein